MSSGKFNNGILDNYPFIPNSIRYAIHLAFYSFPPTKIFVYPNTFKKFDKPFSSDICY